MWRQILILLHLTVPVDFSEEPKTKVVKETVYDWENLNKVKAVWLRDPKDVTAEEYAKFYQSMAKVVVKLLCSY